MREIDGLKVAFIEHDDYFAGFHTDSMHRRQRKTGADIVLLLAEGKSESDVTDEEIRALLSEIATHPTRGTDHD